MCIPRSRPAWALEGESVLSANLGPHTKTHFALPTKRWPIPSDANSPRSKFGAGTEVPEYSSWGWIAFAGDVIISGQQVGNGDLTRSAG
jgi:hypothetical protein